MVPRLSKRLVFDNTADELRESGLPGALRQFQK